MTEYEEGIAWERKRWEMMHTIETHECKCEQPLHHLFARTLRTENGIDYDLEFGDLGQ